MKPNARSFVKTLREKKLRLALAESMTGGLLAQQIANCPGASEVLAGSIVCYTPEVKAGLMRVPKQMLEVYTCESMPVTKALVSNLATLIDADIYAAITGLASKGGSETKAKPVGTVFFSFTFQKQLHTTTSLFRGTPLEIRKKACEELYGLILAMLGESPKK